MSQPKDQDSRRAVRDERLKKIQQVVKGRQSQRQARATRRVQRSRTKLPAPPPRRAAAAAAAPPEPAAPTVPTAPDGVDAAKLRSTTGRHDRLEDRAQLGTVYQAIGRIDDLLRQLPLDLDTLRTRGYYHAGQLDDQMAALEDQWDDTRPRVEEALADTVKDVEIMLRRLDRKVQRLTAGPTAALLEQAEAAIAEGETMVQQAEQALRALYGGIESSLSAVQHQFGKVEQMLGWLAESAEIALRDTEGPLVATKARWQRNSDGSGPDGIVVLTDQRLFFEQREEVVTKRRFGIFKAESETVRKLLLMIEADAIESVEESESGGFLGFGKDELLHLVCAPQVGVTRVQFHLERGDSAEWLALIKRVQSGDIDLDRAEAFVEEVAAADAVATQFPETCPNCMAQLPPARRGMATLRCEFCGSEVGPLDAPA